MEDYFESFRLNLKYYREKNEISQSQLAIGADYTNGLIGQIESGKPKPSFDNICRIATTLDIHPADLFLRNASSTVKHTKSILKQELVPINENLIEKKYKKINK